MITSSTLAKAQVLLRAAYPGITWYEETWKVWTAAINDEGITDAQFMHAVREIVKREQWFPSTALPPLVLKYAYGHKPPEPERKSLPMSKQERAENLKRVRELAAMVERGFVQ